MSSALLTASVPIRYLCLKPHLALLLRRSKSVSQPSGASFVEAQRWIILFGQNGMQVLNDMSAWGVTLSPVNSSESDPILACEIWGPISPLLLQSNSTCFCQSSDLKTLSKFAFLEPVLCRAIP